MCPVKPVICGDLSDNRAEDFLKNCGSYRYCMTGTDEN